MSAFLLLLTGSAQAQIGLPALPRPGLPLGGVPGVPLVAPGLSVVQAQTSGVLQDVRREAATLIRRNRTLLEADANGYAIVRAQVLMYSPSEEEISAAQAAGFRIERIRELPALNARLVVLRVPTGAPTRRALSRLRTLLPSAELDFNHLYLRSGAERHPATVESAQPAAALDQDPGRAPTKVGLIDGGVDAAHPVFAEMSIHRHGCAGAAITDAHATAVASLLVGRSVQFRGAVAGAELYSADVYCGMATGGAVDALADALGWLAAERIAVVNVSLVGPPNATLAAVVQSMLQHGHLIVAAVGNDGPAAPPLYPAAYPGVIGVTAVDKTRHALMEAERGPQVKFAAPGADMAAAQSPRGFTLVRGTSFAAPIVAGLLASLLSEPDGELASSAVAQLARGAIDLGAPGVDPVYGYGLVGEPLGPDAGLAR